MRSRSKFAPAIALLVTAVLGGCGSLSLGNSSGTASGPSIGDRFSQLFGTGSRPQPVGSGASAATPDVQDCPEVFVRNGASTLSVGQPGRPARGMDLRFQATIVDTARECRLAAGQVMVSLGIRGRVIVGPAGAPPAAELPLRIALVQEGPQPRTVYTKLYQTNVVIPPNDANVPYSFVAEDIVYPVPTGGAGDTYVFYVGFDPLGAQTQPPQRRRRR